MAVVCENLEKSILGQKLVGQSPPPPPPQLPQELLP